MSTRLFFILGLSLVLTACKGEDQVEAPKQTVRSIKSMVVKERATNQIRRISGIVEADTVTDLSFETSGQIVKLQVDIGSFVNKGQVLGELDTEPYRLNVQKAKSELDSAQASLKDAREKFQQQSQLIKKGFTTKTSFDTATANLERAESQLKIVATQLSIAERDLRKTVLKAPFRGRISEKYVDVFAEVQPGQKILQIHTEGKSKVEVSVPEGLRSNIESGNEVEIAFPTLQGLKSTGKVEDIGSRTGTGNAFPVTINLDRQFPELRPGISAEVTFKFATEAQGTTFIVPNTALVPTNERGKARLFVFDKGTKTVKARSVTVVNIRDNDLEIVGDINAGEIIAIAGVSFLEDGMKVRLWKRQQ